MDINLDVLKQVREAADWAIALPQKLVSAVMGTKEEYFRRRERITKYKELVEIREIGKMLSGLYYSKGSIVGVAKLTQETKDPEYIGYVRELFEEVSVGLGQVMEAIAESNLSSLSLVTEASMQIGKAKTTYEALHDLPDEAILTDARLEGILIAMEEMIASGRALQDKVDEQRSRMDGMFD